MLTISETIGQLEALQANSVNIARVTDRKLFCQQDMDACKSAIVLLTALQEQGLNTVREALGRIRSYPVVSAAYRELRAWFKTGSTPVKIHGTRCCPKCHEAVGMKHRHCPWCGKRLNQRWEKL